MKLISLLTSDSAADLDCDYALIELTPELARIALRRIDAFKAQKAAARDLDEIYFWDFHTEYFSPWIAEKATEAEALDEMLSRLPTAASGSDWMTAPDSFSVPESMATHVDCSQMILTRSDGVGFRPTHSRASPLSSFAVHRTRPVRGRRKGAGRDHRGHPRPALRH